jgi:hypothetical protein
MQTSQGIHSELLAAVSEWTMAADHCQAMERGIPPDVRPESGIRLDALKAAREVEATLYQKVTALRDEWLASLGNQ